MLIEQVKADLLAARKAGGEANVVKRTLLTTLIGEADMVGKNAGNRAPTDEETQEVIAKFIKNNKATLKALPADDHRRAGLKEETAILQGYLPKQLTEAELTNIIQSVIASADEATRASPKMKGLIMKQLTGAHRGLYDGAQAAALITKLLSA